MFYLLLHFIYSFAVTLSILIPDQCSSTLPASLQPLRACLLHTISSAWQRNALCVCSLVVPAHRMNRNTTNKDVPPAELWTFMYDDANSSILTLFYSKSCANTRLHLVWWGTRHYSNRRLTGIGATRYEMWISWDQGCLKSTSEFFLGLM